MTISETSFDPTPIDLPTVRDAARRELRAQGASATDDLPAAILERLAANEPVTSPLLFFAVRSGDASLSSSAERQIELPLAAQIEAIFQAEVEEFCREFFELDPETRRAGWIMLRRQTSASPALTARLEELSRGLDVDCRTLLGQKPAVQRVAALVREFFVLPPFERAVKRRAWLASHAADAKRLRRAAGRLAGSYPKIADLDPVLIQHLGTPGRPRSWRRRVRIDVAIIDETPFRGFLRSAAKTVRGTFFSMVGLCILVALIPLLLPRRSVPSIPSVHEQPPPDGFSWPDKPDPPTSPLIAPPAKLPQRSSAPPVAKKPGGGR